MFGRWHIGYSCIILVWVILHGKPIANGQQQEGEDGNVAAEADLVSGVMQDHHHHRRNSPNINPFDRLYGHQSVVNNELVLSRQRRQSDEGYIVKLYAECPTTVSGVGRFVLKADVPAYAFARCKNGNLTFDESNKPIYTLPIIFAAASANQCQFYKKTKVDVYTVMVEIGWGEESNEMMRYARQELVTCGYDAHGNSSSVSHKLHDFVIAPKENENLLGAVTSSLFSLTVINVLDVSIDNWDFNIGRLIRLRATAGGNAQQIAGMRALSCDAKNDAGDSYAVLRGGCGDGVIFPKTTGFITETGGLTVYSPYFISFKLRGGIDLRFECTLVVCTSSCQGNSCLNVV